MAAICVCYVRKNEDDMNLEEVAHARLPTCRDVTDERVDERTSWYGGIVQIVERSGVERIRQGGDACC